ncbi:S53 family peptidase [Kribbella sp. NPDC051952]|uniref:S53 family peptidase n=1 Tax=Kribbella sp. NPDC051952 TaxID=3154851 RepID=UPI0034121375
MQHTNHLRDRVRRRLGHGLVVAAALCLVASAAPQLASARSGSAQAGPIKPERVCSEPAAHHAACLAILDRDANGAALTPAAARALDLHPFMAADLQSAYKLPSALLGGRQTIAIIDAFDDPFAESDLAVYRAANNLPACDADNPCFRKVNQRGGDTPPQANTEWAAEISLDLDMASAACPNCRLLLVEADDNDTANLGAAVDEAVRLGATIISNSYGAPEYPSELVEAGDHYNHPGTTILASTGDSGYGVAVPAALSTVVAVGGTTLYEDSNARGWSETAWAGAGSGCSAYVAKPAWQKDRACGKRTVADVAAVADPHTPVAVYDTFGFNGWIALGGTSAASPLLAGVYALAGNAGVVNTSSRLYAHSTGLFDVTTGATGNCGGSYLCTAVRKYDGPTGLGTPNGIGAF